MKTAVLIIGKDGHLRRHLESRLHSNGCDVVATADPNDGIRHALDSPPDVVMLGSDLPDADSLELCRQIRSGLHPQRMPVFLLAPDDRRQTGENQPAAVLEAEDRWKHVETGIGASLSLSSELTKPRQTLVVNGLEMDRRRQQVKVDGRSVKLTRTEFRLLWTLAEDPGSVFDRDQLRQVCSGSSKVGQGRTVDVHIKAIRSKLLEHSGLIETVHGTGYRFRED